MCYFCTERKSMKHNKIFAVLALAATLTLAACGGAKDSSASKPSSGSKQTPTTSKEPPKPVKAASIDDVKLAKKDDGKVYVQLKGSETLYTATDKLEYAFGVTAGDGTVPEATEENPNPSDGFIIGHAAPKAEDFKAITFTPAADATKVEFNLEYCLTDIANIETGVYRFFGGFTAESYAELEFVEANAEFTGRDQFYDYFIRNDTGTTGLAIEDLGHVLFNTASIVKDPDADHTGLWLKATGTPNAAYSATAYTQEQLDAFNTKLDFQRMNGYMKTSNTQFFWKAEGNNAHLFISVAQLVSDLSADNPTRRYMTHVTSNAPANVSPWGFNPGKLLTQANILENNVYSFAEENVKITVISDLSKSQNDGEDHFYGALGLQVEYINAPAPVEAE